MVKKTYLTPADKKRIAFIKQEFHDTADSVIAYIVFAHPRPGRREEEGSKEVVDPYQVASQVARAADGSNFRGRTIRTDLAVRSKGGRKAEDGDLLDDPKMTVFVGNLDFASKEEDLRAFFETLMVKEKGDPAKPHAGTSEDGEDDSESEVVGEPPWDRIDEYQSEHNRETEGVAFRGLLKAD